MSAKSRTLIIDAQLFQSFTFHRGMGKYSLSLLEKLANHLTGYTHKIIVFNNISGYLSDVEMRRVKEAASGFSFEYLSFKHLGDPGEYKQVYEHNRGVIDEYIANRLPGEEIDYLILSLFQETEVSAFPTVCARKSVIVYDLIPLQLFDIYLKVDSVAQNYLSRFNVLLEADHFFPISRSVATELTLHLGIPKQRITPIYGAPAKRLHLEREEIEELSGKRIILFPSGDDVRKNNDLTVEAFKKFNKKHNDEFTLVITSSFTDASKERLYSLSKNVYFSGNVTEQQLAWLYHQSELVLFLSHAEGLGMPILEAVEFDKKIVCSEIDVFKEMSNNDFYFCDPYSSDSIESVIEEAMNGPIPNQKAYQKILDYYNWDNTAVKMTDVLNVESKEKVCKKKRVAIMGPDPRGFSAIGKVIQEQHYELSRIADVVYFFEQGVSDQAKKANIRKNYLAYAVECRDPWQYDNKSQSEFDQTIYHIGNGEYHVTSLVKALAYPDTVILHDSRIRGLYGVVKDQGLISSERFEAEELLDNVMSPTNGNFLTSLVSKQDAVIAHSEYAIKGVKEALVGGKSLKVQHLNLAIPAAYYVETKVPKSNVSVAIAGVMTESKGINLADSITRIKHDQFRFNVRVFGFSMLPAEFVNKLKRNKAIELIQSPSDTRFMFELMHSDILLNYRHPYHGETSYSTLDGMRFGKNVIINNMGWFAELPDSLVCKVGSVDDAVSAISGVVERDTAEERQKRIEYIESHHSVSNYVRRVVQGRLV